MESMDAEYTQCLHKIVYMGQRRYLEENHPWRYAWRLFNGQHEFRPAPRRPIGEYIRQKVEEREEFVDNQHVSRDNKNLPKDPVKEHGVKRRSKLFDISYWKVCSPINPCLLLHNWMAYFDVPLEIQFS
jgi:hypothetical protein